MRLETEKTEQVVTTPALKYMLRFDAYELAKLLRPHLEKAIAREIPGDVEIVFDASVNWHAEEVDGFSISVTLPVVETNAERTDG